MTLLIAALTLAPTAIAPSLQVPASGQGAGNVPQKPVQTPPAQNPPAQNPPAQTPPSQSGTGQTGTGQTTTGTGQTATGQKTTTGPQATNNFSVYGLTVQDMNGNNVPLSAYQGKALIIVNTASYSVYDNQLRDLSTLYQSDSGRIAVIGFPSNDFNHEPQQGGTPGTNTQLANRYKTLGVTFPVYGPVHVTGPNMSPLYQFLVLHSPTPNVPIEGDYVKFVTDHQGRIIARLRPTDGPMSINFQMAIQGIR